MPRRSSSSTAIRRDGLGRLSLLAAVVLVGVVPFVWDSGALEAFRGLQAELAMAAWVALAATFVVRADRPESWSDPWRLAWGGVLASCVLAALASGETVRALGNVLPLALAALGFGALRRLPQADRERLVILVVASGVLEALLVLAFLSPALQPGMFAHLDFHEGRYAWIGTLGNPGYVGIFLTMPTLLALSRALDGDRRRVFYAAAAMLQLLVLVGSQTLTAAAAVVAGGAVLAWRRLSHSRRVPVLAGLAALGVALSLASPLRGRLVDALTSARAGELMWLGSARGAAFTAAGAMVAAHPWFGVGPGLFEANSFRVLSEDALADRAWVLGMQTGFGEAHNDLLQHAAETGMLGSLLALAGIVLAVRRETWRPGMVVDRAALLAAAAVLVLTQFPLHLACIVGQWAVLAALVLPGLPVLPHPSSRRRTAELGIVLALATAGAVLAWQRHTTARAFQQGSLLVSSLRAGAPVPARQQAARAALASLQGRERWLPDSYAARIILGSLAFEAGRQAVAMQQFSAALALAERPETRFDLGMALVAAGEREIGLGHLMRAIELNPATFTKVTDAELASALRLRLDASGYGQRHPWVYQGTPRAR